MNVTINVSHQKFLTSGSLKPRISGSVFQYDNMHGSLRTLGGTDKGKFVN